MAIDFTLTAEQRALQKTAREFAQEVLKPVVAEADALTDTQQAFVMMKDAYKEAYRLGFAMGFLPKEYGGGDVSNLDLQIAAEEICAVDPGFATILLVNGLGLMPLAWFGSEEQKRKWIGEATSDPTMEYLAGWVVSEAAGTPGGTANFDHPGAHPVGIVTAEHDKGRGEYVLNGKKYWPCNAGGWDLKGADVNVVIVRTDPTKGGKEGLSAILVCGWRFLRISVSCRQQRPSRAAETIEFDIWQMWSPTRIGDNLSREGKGGEKILWNNVWAYYKHTRGLPHMQSHVSHDEPTRVDVWTVLKELPQRVQALLKRHDASQELGFEELEHELHALFTHAECAATSEALERHDVDLPHVFIDAEKHHRAYRCEKTYLCAVGPVTAMRTLYRARPGERAVAAWSARQASSKGTGRRMRRVRARC